VSILSNLEARGFTRFVGIGRIFLRLSSQPVGFRRVLPAASIEVVRSVSPRDLGRRGFGNTDSGPGVGSRSERREASWRFGWASAHTADFAVEWQLTPGGDDRVPDRQE
jgi:hypothetical protein